VADMRNAFEHFDERLDAYLARPHAYLLDRNTGQPGRIMVIGDRPAKPRPNLDPFAWQVTHLDEPAADIEAFVALVEDLRRGSPPPTRTSARCCPRPSRMASPVEWPFGGADRELASPAPFQRVRDQERSTNASRSAACTSASSPSPSEK